jgi:hypothetical protein
LNAMMTQQEFIQSRAAAHSVACEGIANDPTVQMAMAMHAANLEVKAAIAARTAAHACKSNVIAQLVFAAPMAVEQTIFGRRQAG